MLDRDRLHDDFTAAIASAAESSDAVNGSVGFISFVSSKLREHASDPVAMRAIADMLDECKTGVSQAVVANTMHEPQPQDEQVQQPAALQTTSNEPTPLVNQGTEAQAGDGTVQEPTADTPSYVPGAPGVTAGTVKTDAEIAAEDQKAEQQEAGKTGKSAK